MVRIHRGHLPAPQGILPRVNEAKSGLPGQASPSPPCAGLLPHEAQEHQQDQADQPPRGGKGLGHGECTGTHDEVKHVHQSHLEATEVTFKPPNELTSPPQWLPKMTPGASQTGGREARLELGKQVRRQNSTEVQSRCALPPAAGEANGNTPKAQVPHSVRLPKMSLLIGFLLRFCCYYPATLSCPVTPGCASDVSSLPDQAVSFLKTHHHIGGPGTRMNLVLTSRNPHSSKTSEHVT